MGCVNSTLVGVSCIGGYCFFKVSCNRGGSQYPISSMQRDKIRPGSNNHVKEYLTRTQSGGFNGHKCPLNHSV